MAKLKTNRLTVVTSSLTEQNPFFDARLCGNGGGYSQPLITIVLSNGGKIVIDDTSCGDFGDRYTISYHVPGRKTHSFTVNQMDDVCYGDLDKSPDYEQVRRIVGNFAPRYYC